LTFPIYNPTAPKNPPIPLLTTANTPYHSLLLGRQTRSRLLNLLITEDHAISGLGGHPINIINQGQELLQLHPIARELTDWVATKRDGH
jgi:hypothetical protein